MTEEEKEAMEEFKREYNDGRILESDIIIELNTARIVIDLIEKLQKENQQLKEENIILEGNKIGYKLAIQELKERFIPKEKVDAEIKELEENEDFYREQGRMYEYEGKINLLKRLLEKE